MAGFAAWRSLSPWLTTTICDIQRGLPRASPLSGCCLEIVLRLLLSRRLLKARGTPGRDVPRWSCLPGRLSSSACELHHRHARCNWWRGTATRGFADYEAGTVA